MNVYATQSAGMKPNTPTAQIRDKREFYALYNRFQLGNRLRNWSLAEWHALDRTGKFPVSVIAARCVVRTAAPMRYDLPPQQALSWVRAVCEREGMPPDSYQFSELAPDHINTLQAEVMRTEEYFYLRYTLFSHQRMRDCIQRARHVTGLRALGLLQQYMDSASYEYTQELFDRYPDSIIEFCCYEKPVGVFGWNTLFWEVRNY